MRSAERTHKRGLRAVRLAEKLDYMCMLMGALAMLWRWQRLRGHREKRLENEPTRQQRFVTQEERPSRQFAWWTLMQPNVLIQRRVTQRTDAVTGC